MNWYPANSLTGPLLYLATSITLELSESVPSNTTPLLFQKMPWSPDPILHRLGIWQPNRNRQPTASSHEAEWSTRNYDGEAPRQMRPALPAAMSVDLVALMTLTLSVTAIFGRRQSGEFTKCPRERTRFTKANPGADPRHRERRPLQQALGAIHTAGHVVAMRRRAEGLREGARKMIKAQIDEFCESRQRNVLREMLLDEFDHAFLLPCWQAAAHRSRCGGCRSFQSEELVHQHQAQGVRIFAAPRVGIADLGLELKRGVPDGLIEEEQARADRGTGDAGSPIK